VNLYFLLVFLGIAILFSSAYATYKFGWKGVVFILPVVVLMLFMTGFNGSIPTLVLPVLVGSVAGQTLKKNMSLDSFILVTALLMTLVYTGNYYYLKQYKDYNIVKESKTQMLEIIKSTDIPKDKKKQLTDNIDTLIAIAEDVAPFSFFVNSLILSALGYFMIQLLFTKLFGTLNIKGLEYFRLNDYAIFILIGGWLSFLVVDKSEYEILYLAGLNIGLIVSALYLVQALGVVRFLLIKKNKPVHIFTLTLILTFILSVEAFVFIIILLTGFGTLDLWADFRKLDIKSADQH
jgi:hypothetical protein